MAFPWELNLDRTYGDEKSFPEREPGASRPTRYLAAPARNSMDFRQMVRRQATSGGPDPESPAKHKPRLPSHWRGW